MDRGAIGRKGEEVAARYLRRNGCRILRTNYRTRRGEIDLIAADGQELVFVEVRFRRSSGYGTPAETVGGAKRRRLILAAGMYLLQRGDWDAPCRFDVIALTPGPDGGFVVEHYKNAFDRDGRPGG